MKRTKFSDYILNNLWWTGIFLYDIVYFSRAERILKDLKESDTEITQFALENNDIIIDFTIIEGGLTGERAYKIKLR